MPARRNYDVQFYKGEIKLWNAGVGVNVRVPTRFFYASYMYNCISNHDRENLSLQTVELAELECSGKACDLCKDAARWAL